jgi:hypothetical protein
MWPTFVFRAFFHTTPALMMRSNSKQPCSLTGEKAAVSSSDDLRTSCAAGGETETAVLEARVGRRGIETWGGGTGEMRGCETALRPAGGSMMGDREEIGWQER